MKRISFFISLLIVGLTLAACTAGEGATGSSSLSGMITDCASHQPLPNVTVKLSNQNRSATTDAFGRFWFKQLKSGQESVTFSIAGYQRITVKDVTIAEKQTTTLDLALIQNKTTAKSDTVIVAAKLNTYVPPAVKRDASEQKTKARKIGITIDTSVQPPQHGAAALESELNRAAGGALYGTGNIGSGNSGLGYGVAVGVPPQSGYSRNPSLNPPNGKKFEDMYHEGHGTNPFIDTEDDNLSTFGMDVSTASYSLVRNYVNYGEMPPKDAVRVEEFVNYFRQSYTAPRKKTFAVYMNAMTSPISKNYKLVKIGIKAKAVAPEDRKPAYLTFVIDVSGSMGIESRLALVKKTLLLLSSQLREDDRVGIVTYGTTASVLLDHTADKETIEAAINKLGTEGSTNAEAGLWEGYRLAAKHFNEHATNRVILCTDGVANNGETSSEGLLKIIDKYRKQGIVLTTCGFGMGNYNDVLLEQLATKGDGTYHYIDDPKEARRIFVEGLVGTLENVAKDAKIQVEFDKKIVSRFRLLGYEKRDMKHEDFRNDKADAGEVGAGQSVTALYEVKLKDPSATTIGEVRIRYKTPDANDVEEFNEPLRLAPSASDAEHAEFGFIGAVALYAEIMRGSFWAKGHTLADVKALLQDVQPSDDLKADEYNDFSSLVAKTLLLKKDTALHTDPDKERGDN
jgi:Ca-activated chloride channel family protein